LIRFTITSENVAGLKVQLWRNSGRHLGAVVALANSVLSIMKGKVLSERLSGANPMSFGLPVFQL